MINYAHHSFKALIKSVDQSIDSSKISLKDIFSAYAFDIDYEKFIQWCQTNLLVPLTKLDDEEKQIHRISQDQFDDSYVLHRHLNRCIELLNDLQRGTISMTLLPPTNNETQQMKAQLAGKLIRVLFIACFDHEYV